MGIWKSLSGMVEAELTSADLSGALSAVNERGVQIFDVRPQGDLAARFWLYRQDYRTVSHLAQRRGERLKVLRRRGLYWAAKGLLRRPVLLLGMTLLLALVLFVPTRVYFVRVEGNESVPTRRIIAAAEESGIRFGASRREVRSEKIKNALLSAVPELQWAGVNTYGCVAVISVRERSLSQTETVQEGVSNIVAARDGVITSCAVTRGSALCSVGQAVQEGQVLISGYTDCGICITATRAEGEIYAQTRRNLTAVTPSEYESRGDSQRETTKYSLLIGKKRINFYQGSGIWDPSCVKIQSVSYLTLPGGFQLPVALVKETQISYETEPVLMAEEEAESLLCTFAESYLRTHMTAGAITDRVLGFTAGEGVYRLTGEYACTEMIGRVQSEQIGAYYGKTD